MSKSNFLIGALAIALSITSCSENLEEKIEAKVPQLTEMADLGSVEYTVKKIIKANDVGEWYKIGDRKILFSCTAYLKAGVNLNNFSMKNVQIDNSSKSVTVKLPHAEVLSINMPAEETKLVYDQVSLLRSNFTAEERNSLLRQGEADILGGINEIGIIKDAEENASEFIKAMLMQMGFSNVTVNFE